jgi:hypothetical protein
MSQPEILSQSSTIPYEFCDQHDALFFDEFNIVSNLYPDFPNPTNGETFEASFMNDYVDDEVIEHDVSDNSDDDDDEINDDCMKKSNDIEETVFLEKRCIDIVE